MAWREIESSFRRPTQDSNDAHVNLNKKITNNQVKFFGLDVAPRSPSRLASTRTTKKYHPLHIR